MPTIEKKAVRKILLIKLRGIGDVILSTIVVENLLLDFPDAEIHYLTEKPSNFALQENPQIKKIHLFDRKSTWRQFTVLTKIRKEKYDLVFDFFSNSMTAMITYCSGALYRVGFPYKGRKFAYNIYGPPERDKYHQADLHLEALEMAGLSHSYSNLLFALNTSDYSVITNELDYVVSSYRLLIGISPSGGWESKKCDPIKLAEIADSVNEKYNANIIILWGPGDIEHADNIRKFMKSKSILAPPTDIRQMAALISKCSALIANDSGPMHISTAVGTPVLSLHGPTDPKLQGPYGDKHEWINKDDLDCIICNKLECPRNHECFLELPIEKIMTKFELLLRKNNLN